MTFNTEGDMLPEKGASRRKKKASGAPGKFLITLLCLLLPALLAFAAAFAVSGRSGLPDSVIRYRAAVTKAADACGIADYRDYLLAIMEVESEGRKADVMQSSESMGLRPGTLGTDESITQGCRYFRQLLDQAKKDQVDFDAVLQAYNFGPGYLDYVAENGGKHTAELAAAFAKEKSGGKTVRYRNPVARGNGYVRYDYGNMYYAELVHAACAQNEEGKKMSHLSRILVTASALSCFFAFFLETAGVQTGLIGRWLHLKEAERRRNSTVLLVRSLGIANGLVGAGLLYGCYFSRASAEICALLLAIKAAAAFFGAVNFRDRWMVLRQGGIAIAALVSLFFK